MIDILYIEDNLSNQQLMQAVLQLRSDINLEISVSAEDGLENIKKKKPDIILLDIDLPGMDGYEFIELLQSNDSYKNIPVVAVTAKAMLDDIVKAEQYNFAAYLTKPIQLEALYAAIDSQ